MGKRAGKLSVIAGGGKNPLRGLSVWGVNIVRSPRDLEGAPAPVVEGYAKCMRFSSGLSCGCCGNEIVKCGGMAVLRCLPPDPAYMVLGLCPECLKEPDSNKLTPRIIKTLTGRTTRSVDAPEKMQPGRRGDGQAQ